MSWHPGHARPQLCNNVGMPPDFHDSQDFARDQDEADPLRAFRSEFLFPEARHGEPVYLTGNSLGLQPQGTRALIEQELEDWARLGVDAHLQGRDPWLPYHEQFRGPLGRVVGAQPHEVVMMNSLTVNLHLLMVSFYRPTRERFKIVIEDTAFPSDSYAVASQAQFHGFGPGLAVIRLKPREGEHTLRTDDVLSLLEREGKSVALVMLGAVNYLTGQWFEMDRITEAGHKQGCVVGWDLAHAAGNVPVQLHDWNVDFAAWCTYKYLNSGPGAVAGAFVHEKHTRDRGPASLPRFAGWWGNDPATRFRMGPDFVPVASADAWQLSNPPILALAPVKASLEIFDRAGMSEIREKSLRLTGYMEYLIERWCGGKVRSLTPRDPSQRGAQLSLVVTGAGRAIEKKLHERGVWVDYREPDVFRAAPTALYNSFGDVRRFVELLREVIG
jgi:kynureninase